MMRGVVGLVWCVAAACVAATSTSKAHVYLNACNKQSSSLLFPLDRALPTHWSSCNDAYEYTWMSDFGGHLKGVSLVNRMRLAYSMGFCPHLRCQLASIGNTDADGTCPEGACFTKLEHGRPSFGGCCYKNGSFVHGDLIGYYYKTQPFPKPIYRRNRIVLGEDKDDTGEASFINANEVYPGIIIAQCPLTGHPFGWKNTLEDTKQLMLEQNVSYVLQIAPTSHDGSIPPAPASPDASRVCRVWPLEFLLNSTSHHSIGVDVETAHKQFFPAEHRWQFEYNLWGYLQHNEDNSNAVSDRSPFDNCTERTTRGNVDSPTRVKHQWFYNWRDFVTPEISELTVIQELARNASTVVKDGGKVLISCYSGRGRSGTLAAIIAAMASGITTDDELVRLIVTMRESRDGLVETPAQYHFIRLALGMASMGLDKAEACTFVCKFERFLDITSQIVRVVLDSWAEPVSIDVDDHERSTKYITLTASQTHRLLFEHILSDLDYLHTAFLATTFLFAVCISATFGALCCAPTNKPHRKKRMR